LGPNHLESSVTATVSVMPVADIAGEQ